MEIPLNRAYMDEKGNISADGLMWRFARNETFE